MRVVTPLTLVMAYYENPKMLQQHYGIWAMMSPEIKEHVRVVIVDDGSPIRPALPPYTDELRSQITVQIYRLRKDVRWNQDACRNIGVAHSETNWVLLTDIDHIVTEGTWRHLLASQWDERKAYKFRRISAPDLSVYKPHPNSWFMTRKLYDRAGGYDERFAGLYGTDGDFRDRVVKTASEVNVLKEALMRVPRSVVGDASTTTYLRKQPEDRAGLERVRAIIAAEGPDAPTVRGTFEYDRVYP